MTFPTIPTGGRILDTVQADTTSTRTFPDLSSLTKDAGDLLIAICLVYDGNSTNAEFSSWGGGFTEFGDFATTSSLSIGCAYKFSTGSETGTFTVASTASQTGHAALFLMSIPGAHASTAPEAGGYASGTNANANPGSLDPGGWATEDTLWIAVAGCGETLTTGSFTGMTAGGAPASYTDAVFSGTSADVVGGIDCAVAFRQNAAGSEDPATFTCDATNSRWGALTIAVRPAAAAPDATVEPAVIARSVTLSQAGGAVGATPDVIAAVATLPQATADGGGAPAVTTLSSTIRMG